jgi:prephenate dehydrogenase
MAIASHLPQLTANALGAVMARFGLRRDALGPGGKDMTRLAGSSAEMWTDLLEHAPEALGDALEAMAETVTDLKDRLETDQVESIGELMRRSRTWFEGGEWS